MTTEERLDSVEHSIQHHDASINLLITLAERQQALLERVETHLEKVDDHLEEVRRDSQMTRRLWVHMARKNGWLEDGDWPPPEK